MKEKTDLNKLIAFSDELGKIGIKLFKEIYGQTYLEEEDLQQRIGHLFLKKNYPVLREVGLPKKVFDVTFKKGEFPDFVFFEDIKNGFEEPFIIEFKHDKKIKAEHRAQLGSQLNLAQATVINKQENLRYGFMWNIVKTDFKVDQSDKFEECLSEALEKFSKREDERTISIMVAKLLNLYLLEFNFYSDTKKEKQAVLKKIKTLMNSENYFHNNYLQNNQEEFSTNFISAFEEYNSLLNPVQQNATLVNGVTMKIVKPDVKVEVELWKLTNGNNHELGIELIERKTYG
jgi:hypothetical protein